jgi:hypothetical protein
MSEENIYRVKVVVECTARSWRASSKLNYSNTDDSTCIHRAPFVPLWPSRKVHRLAKFCSNGPSRQTQPPTTTPSASSSDLFSSAPHPQHPQRKQSKQKPRPLSAAEKRRLCLNEIPKEQQKYAIYEPLHNLWLGYMREVLGVNDAQRAVYLTPASSGQMLASADMHGALLTIVRSRCVSRVGLAGIVVRDTRFTFDIITKHNVLKCKSESVQNR